MFINAYDMARFGYLFLRNGKWKDRQLPPDTDWIFWPLMSIHEFSYPYHRQVDGVRSSRESRFECRSRVTTTHAIWN